MRLGQARVEYVTVSTSYLQAGFQEAQVGGGVDAVGTGVQQDPHALKGGLAKLQAIIDFVLEGAQVHLPDHGGVNLGLLVKHWHHARQVGDHQLRFVVGCCAQKLYCSPPQMPAPCSTLFFRSCAAALRRYHPVHYSSEVVLPPSSDACTIQYIVRQKLYGSHLQMPALSSTLFSWFHRIHSDNAVSQDTF